MKKLLLLMLLVPMFGAAQWESRTVDNGFDPAYKIAYTETNNDAFLKIENYDGDLIFYLQGSFFCDEDTEVDISYMVNGAWQKFTYAATISMDRTTVFISADLVNSPMFEAFKSASLVKLRVRQMTCTTEIFQFSMTNSTKTINFMK